MKKNLSQKILQDLFESSNGLYAYSFYSRYKIKANELISFINKYEKEGIIGYDDGRLNITEKGKKFVLSSYYTISHFNKSSKYSSIPTVFLGKKIEINSLYLPNIKTLPKELKNKIEGDGN